MNKLSIILFLMMFSCLPCRAEEKTKITFLWWSDPGGRFEEVISDFDRNWLNARNIEELRDNLLLMERRRFEVKG